jgi:RNA polymerase-binding protein DksA
MAKATRTTTSSAKPSPKPAAKTTKTVRSVKPVKSVKAAKTTKSVRPAKPVATAKAAATKKTATKKTVKSVKAAPAKAAKKAAGPVKGGSVRGSVKANKATAAKKAPAKAAAKKAPAKAAAKKAPAKATKVPAKAVATKAVKAKVVKGPPALVPKPAPSRPVLSEVVTRKHRTPAVAPSTMERLKIQLIDERAQHVRQMEGLQAEAEALANEREPGDTQFDEESGEGDTLSVERERDLALSTAARQTVEDIAKALARMEDGSYGYCEVCGDRIPVPRLEAIPWADQCVKCKSRGERRR